MAWMLEGGSSECARPFQESLVGRKAIQSNPASLGCDATHQVYAILTVSTSDIPNCCCGLRDFFTEELQALA